MPNPNLIYQLNIITNEPQIVNKKRIRSITRFLIVSPAGTKTAVEQANKASIYFQTDHSKGILAKVLAKIAQGNVNLSKLQSMPIPGSTFKYGFYADLEFDNKKQIEKVLEALKGLTNSIRIFGMYQKGKVVKG